MKPFISSFRHLPEGTTAVVFDIVEKLCELTPITVLDQKQPRTFERLAASILATHPTGTRVEPMVHKNDYIWSIIGTMKSDAFLHGYQTFFYRIPKESRDSVKHAVMSYLCGTLTRAQFEVQMLACFSRRPRGQDPVEGIYNLVDSDQGVALKAAITLVRKGREADDVAATSPVSAYEMRYCLSYLNKDTR